MLCLGILVLDWPRDKEIHIQFFGYFWENCMIGAIQEYNLYNHKSEIFPMVTLNYFLSYTNVNYEEVITNKIDYYLPRVLANLIITPFFFSRVFILVLFVFQSYSRTFALQYRHFVWFFSSFVLIKKLCPFPFSHLLFIRLGHILYQTLKTRFFNL